MKQLYFFAVGLLFAGGITAHPGIGIVCDSRGNIFYSDLENIWKTGPDGNKAIVVHNVHSHELSLDASDNLYGEHLWYNGEALNTWGHYTWCLKANGDVVKIKDSSNGFLENDGLLRDAAGNVYWVERFTTSKFRKKQPDGNIVTIAEGKFGDIRWSHCTKAGIIYFADSDKLYRLTPNGKFTLLASNLDERGVVDASNDRRDVYGIWTDTGDNIYVAVINKRLVKKITKDGRITTIIQSASGWMPTSGVFDKSGKLWLLENSDRNEVRVRKVDMLQPAHQKNRWSFGLNYLVPAATAFAVIFLIIFFAKKNKNSYQ